MRAGRLSCAGTCGTPWVGGTTGLCATGSRLYSAVPRGPAVLEAGLGPPALAPRRLTAGIGQRGTTSCMVQGSLRLSAVWSIMDPGRRALSLLRRCGASVAFPVTSQGVNRDDQERVHRVSRAGSDARLHRRGSGPGADETAAIHHPQGRLRPRREDDLLRRLHRHDGGRSAAALQVARCRAGTPRGRRPAPAHGRPQRLAVPQPEGPAAELHLRSRDPVRGAERDRERLPHVVFERTGSGHVVHLRPLEHVRPHAVAQAAEVPRNSGGRASRCRCRNR